MPGGIRTLIGVGLLASLYGNYRLELSRRAEAERVRDLTARNGDLRDRLARYERSRDDAAAAGTAARAERLGEQVRDQARALANAQAELAQAMNQGENGRDVPLLQAQFKEADRLVQEDEDRLRVLKAEEAQAVSRDKLARSQQNWDRKGMEQTLSARVRDLKTEADALAQQAQALRKQKASPDWKNQADAAGAQSRAVRAQGQALQDELLARRRDAAGAGVAEAGAQAARDDLRRAQADLQGEIDRAKAERDARQEDLKRAAGGREAQARELTRLKEKVDRLRAELRTRQAELGGPAS